MNRKEQRFLAKTAPNDHTAKLQSAFALHQQGNFAGAEKFLRQVLAIEPDQADATRMLGEVLADLGRFNDAIKLLQSVTKRQPGNAQAHYSLGNACRLGGQFDPAIRAYQAALALDPDFAGSHHGLATAYRMVEREHEALEHLRVAARLAPNWAVIWKDLGLTFAALGKLSLAEAAFGRAVTLQPKLAAAQRHLAALQSEPAEAAELAALSSRAEDLQTPLDERIDLYFALGRLAEKAGAYDTAFGQFTTANRLLRDALGKARPAFDKDRLRSDIDQIIATFSPEGFAAFTGFGNPSEKPVFIVGMPRSGSTLFEQIAATHPKVFGAGERYGIGAIARRLGWAPSPSWTETAIGAAASEYLASLPVTGAARIIDKMPDNIFQLGLIAILFPNARVIFCERDPRDLALSCFFQHFSEPYGFDTDLEDLAFRIKELDRLKHHWLQALPLRCLTFTYEALIADPEAESRRLIEFLGLEWDERCLAFHETERVVRTASWAQVRKPLYADSAGRWENYEPHLGPLLKALS